MIATGRDLDENRFSASQPELCFYPIPCIQTSGSIESVLAQDILRQLNQRAVPGIKFNPMRLESNVYGGLCSAMTMGFLHLYFRMCAERNFFTFNEFSSCLDGFVQLNQVMRTCQAAFNAIEVDKKIVGDASRDKMQSLLNSYDIQIVASSEEVNCVSRPREIKEMLKRLPDGVYLIRMIRPAENHKMEEYGHSMAYIKESGRHWFFDPNQGVVNLDPAEDPAGFVNNFLFLCYRSWEVSLVRCYRLEPRTL